MCSCKIFVLNEIVLKKQMCLITPDSSGILVAVAFMPPQDRADGGSGLS
jgi:hypothetical protein